MFDRVIGPLLGYVAGILLFCLMTLTCVDVIGRYFFNTPVTGGFELTEMMLAALIFFGLPLVTIRNEHVTVDLLDPVTPDWLLRIQHVVVVPGLRGRDRLSRLAALASRRQHGGGRRDHGAAQAQDRLPHLLDERADGR